MTPRNHTALRFNHPDLDPGRSGLQLTPRGSVATVSEDDSVRQSVLLLLSTRPGERVMRPNYGCDLFQLMFSPNDDTTAAIAMHYVQQALLRWEPRIEILTLDAGRDPELPGVLLIQLAYRVRTTRTVEHIDLSLDLAGENT